MVLFLCKDTANRAKDKIKERRNLLFFILYCAILSFVIHVQSWMVALPQYWARLANAYFIPFLLSASEYLAAFFRCSPYVAAKLCVPLKSSFAHIYM